MGSKLLGKAEASAEGFAERDGETDRQARRRAGRNGQRCRESCMEREREPLSNPGERLVWRQPQKPMAGTLSAGKGLEGTQTQE